jgi:hypothetical protein
LFNIALKRSDTLIKKDGGAEKFMEPHNQINNSM